MPGRRARWQRLLQCWLVPLMTESCGETHALADAQASRRRGEARKLSRSRKAGPRSRKAGPSDRFGGPGVGAKGRLAPIGVDRVGSGQPAVIRSPGPGTHPVEHFSKKCFTGCLTRSWVAESTLREWSFFD